MPHKIFDVEQLTAPLVPRKRQSIVGRPAQRQSVLRRSAPLPVSTCPSLPVEIIQRILHFISPVLPLSAVSILCLVNHTWLEAGRSVLYKEATVLPNHRGFPLAWLARNAPHVLPNIRALYICADVEATRVLHSTRGDFRPGQMRLQGVTTLWLRDVFYSGGVRELECLLDELSGLRELRLQNVHVPPSEYADPLLPHRGEKGKDKKRTRMTVRFVGHNSEELYALFADARVRELSLHSPTAFLSTARLDALERVVRRHARTVDTVALHLPLLFATDTLNEPLPVPPTALVRALRKCRKLHTLKIWVGLDAVSSSRLPSEALQDALMPILWGTLAQVRRVRICTSASCGRRRGKSTSYGGGLDLDGGEDRHVWTRDVVRRADSALASWVGLQSVAIVVPCRVCAETCAERFRLLVVRGVLSMAL